MSSISTDCSEGQEEAPAFNADQPLPPDFAHRLLAAVTKRLLQRMEDPRVEVTVAEMELVRKLCDANSISFSSLKRGDFGETAQKIAEDEFPFDDEGRQKVVPLHG